MGAAIIAQGWNRPFMLAFFRKAVGTIWGQAIFAIMLLGLVIGLYAGDPSLTGLNPFSASSIATVGGNPVTEPDLRRRVANSLDAARRQQPELDMAQFVASGGVEGTLGQIIDARVLTEFGRLHGLVANDRVVGSLINRIPAFKGPTGAFDPKTYQDVLARLKVSDADFRKDFRAEAIIDMLQVPTRGAVRLPASVAEPYASLLLEARKGQIATIPSDAFGALPQPSEAEVKAFYDRNRARYTLPERRVARYATFSRDRFVGKVAPNEADVARFYQANAATYAAKDTRGFSQIIIQNEADAQKAAAAIRGGKPVAEVAKSLGLTPLTIAPLERPAFERQTDAKVAAAAFAAPRGGVAELRKSGLGWHVVRVDSVSGQAEQTLDQARPGIVAQLTAQKIDEAAAAFVTQLDDEANNGATFDDLAKKYGLATIVTPAVTQTGIDPDQAAYKPAPEMGIIMRDAFKAEPDDDPVVATLGAGKNFALWKLDRVIAAAPRPLAQIRDQVAADARADVQAKAASQIANGIVAKIEKGVPIAQAVAEAGVRLPPLSPAGGRRVDIMQAGQRVPPPLALMFAMVAKKAKALAMPDNRGYFVVYLDSVQRGNAAGVPGLLDQTRSQLSRLAGDEYLQQFVSAAKAEVGVSRNDAAVAALRKALAGGGTSQ
jgi:peptidyl-prolyl cis-trans isomerase D